MTARKMFEKLGYKLRMDGVSLEYRKTIIERNEDKFMYRIIFYYYTETYSSFILNLKDHTFDVLYLDSSLNKAIQKQLEELGWS